MYEEQRQQHLAWHETMELHELVAFQSNVLMDLKMNMPHVADPALKGLYGESIQLLERNLKELVPYFSVAPMPHRAAMSQEDLTAFFSGHLLGFAKTAVRYYAFGITETATPSLRDTFQRQLNQLIALHGKVYYFMLERGLYPSYDLPKLLAADKKNAITAVQMQS